MKRKSLLVCLRVPVLATPGRAAAQGTSPGATPLEEIRSATGSSPTSPAWILTDFTDGWQLWTGSRDVAGNAVALWQYGAGARLSDRHALGVVAGFVAEGVAGNGVYGGVRYRYRFPGGADIDLTGGATRQGEEEIVRLNLEVAVRAGSLGAAYVGRSHRDGGAGYWGRVSADSPASWSAPSSARSWC